MNALARTLNLLTAQVNAGLITVLQALDAVELAKKISQTNNGYLFAPTGLEMELAEQHPTVFCTARNVSRDFPNRIALRA